MTVENRECETVNKLAVYLVGHHCSVTHSGIVEMYQRLHDMDKLIDTDITTT